MPHTFHQTQMFQKTFFLEDGDALFLVPKDQQIIPGCMSNIFRAFAGMTICPLSPTFTMPKTCFPLGGTSSPKFSRSVFS